MPLQARDFHTTTAFAALSVCGLDYAFIHEGWEPSSLYTFRYCGLARRYQLRIRRL